MSDRLSPGDVVSSRYEVQALLGQGAMGAVYRARDRVLDEIVALKAFRLDVRHSDAAVARLRSEIERARRIRHRNVCTIHEYGEDGPLRYIVMAFVKGQDLHSMMRSMGPLAPAIALDYATQTAKGLGAIHDAGIIHGDLNPSKLIVDAAGTVRLLMPAEMKQPGMLIGTPSYMSPEQVMGKRLDGRSDIFSLGVCAFEMLSGEQPFPGDNVTSILYKLVHVDPIEPAHLDRDAVVRQRWHAVFSKVLAKKPGDRYQTAMAFVHDLEDCLGPGFHLSRDPAASGTPQPQAPWASDDTGSLPSRSIPASRPRPGASLGGTPQPQAPRASDVTGSLPSRSIPASPPPPGASLGGGGLLGRLVGGVASAVGAAAEAVVDWTRSIRKRPAGPRLDPARAPRLAGSRPEALGDPALDAVETSVFAPAKVRFGESFLVQVFVHLLEQGKQAVKMATLFDATATKRGFRTLARRVAPGTALTFDLRIPVLEVAEPVQSLVWHGRPESVQFGVDFPDNLTVPGVLVGTLTVIVESVPVGHVKFRLEIVTSGSRVREEASLCDAHPYESVFISYAAEDRAKVLARVQMLDSLKIRYFQDILSLDPGERWERALYRHIDECDLFLLFWSKAARDSAWVLKEVRYALDRKKGDDLAPPEIKPVILEGPPPIPPPPELASLHFNDRLIYLMNASS
jgi:serine/threonine protein kinase